MDAVSRFRWWLMGLAVLALACGRYGLELPLSIEPDREAAVYVTMEGDDAAPGTIEEPMRTLPAAIARARTQNAVNVLIGEGTWAAPVELADRIHLIGGFSPDFSVLDPGRYTTTIQGEDVGLIATKLSHKTLVRGVSIRVADALPASEISENGHSTYGIRATDSSLFLVEVVIRVGDASSGTDGVDRETAGDGTLGEDGFDATGSGGAAGGAPGMCAADPFTAGGFGGDGGTDSGGERDGNPGFTGSDGAGGEGGKAVDAETTGNDGMPGDHGIDGADGAGGVALGSIGVNGEWIAGAGKVGIDGTPGTGGGGGSGGGADIPGFLDFIRQGGGGGGAGGGGGCGGPGGMRGGGGGSSIGVLAVRSFVQLTDVQIQTGVGGDGGMGALGADGGLGGPGGKGGSDAGGDAKNGGNGGAGGDGGAGGHGGGGAGGSSVGVWLAESSKAQIEATTFSLGEAGLGGAGAVSSNGGENGLVLEVLESVP